MTRKTDAVMLEIIGNQLLSIAEEMGVAHHQKCIFQ